MALPFMPWYCRAKLEDGQDPYLQVFSLDGVSKKLVAGTRRAGGVCGVAGTRAGRADREGAHTWFCGRALVGG